MNYPTIEDAIAQMESGDGYQASALVFASGMAACTAVFGAVLRPGERVAVWDYENGDQKNSDRDESPGSRYANEEEERYAAAEARGDQGTMFHAGQEDLQAFWDLHREAPDLQKIAAQVQHTAKPKHEREIDNERHF